MWTNQSGHGNRDSDRVHVRIVFEPHRSNRNPRRNHPSVVQTHQVELVEVGDPVTVEDVLLVRVVTQVTEE